MPPAKAQAQSNLLAFQPFTVDSNGHVIRVMAVQDEPEIDERGKQIRFYTIGYEGITLDAFIEKLKNNNISQLIDVREKPISRKKGFSKKALSARLDEEGIRYIHMPELGSPSDVRHEYKEGGSATVFFSKYREYVRVYEMGEIYMLDQYVSEAPSAIMCFEHSPSCCHRSVLAEYMCDMGHKAVHL